MIENKNISFYENEELGTIQLNTKTPEHMWSVLAEELKTYLNGDSLEIGSGTGVYYEYLKNSKSLTSIELTDVNIKHLKAKGYNNIIKHDLNNYPYPFEDNSFDFILFSHVLEHLYSPVLALTECHRILKPGGILLLGVPNCDTKIYNNWDFEGHYYAMNYKGWEYIIKKTGFNINKTYFNGLLSSNKTYLKLMQPFFKFLGLDPWFICKK
ncbi:MAG: class I SAM-dependent methyltransferase [Candidatus Gracilibacteria bacterium]|nr:class I SAM-dependent methyltransferase [Candidatus Gracilibacteria bacterium]